MDEFYLEWEWERQWKPLNEEDEEIGVEKKKTEGKTKKKVLQQ